jgi:hypothetical protein
MGRTLMRQLRVTLITWLMGKIRNGELRPLGGHNVGTSRQVGGRVTGKATRRTPVPQLVGIDWDVVQGAHRSYVVHPAP